MNKKSTTVTTKSSYFPSLGPVGVYHLVYEMDLCAAEYQQFNAAMGGFNPTTKELSPLRFSDGFGFDMYLSSLTGALEHGLVCKDRWVQQLFADDSEFDTFLDALEEYDQRLCDRQYRMIRTLSGSDWPCASNPDAAFLLREAAARPR